ncbi:unnamed protein product [Linum trigynum]|uniref:Uncharacterized protein n=1 Tax=Linum trigynum TaxID=586398 RepID=A0AAV2E8A6_9ROSI
MHFNFAIRTSQSDSVRFTLAEQLKLTSECLKWVSPKQLKRGHSATFQEEDAQVPSRPWQTVVLFPQVEAETGCGQMKQNMYENNRIAYKVKEKAYQMQLAYMVDKSRLNTTLDESDGVNLTERQVFPKPRDFEWQLLMYTDVNAPLGETDVD